VSLKANNNQITAILLAAGESRRLGVPKQLLKFKNELLINYILNQIKKAGLSKIKVVLGSRSEVIKQQICITDLEIAVNQDWEEGISSSIRCGLYKISAETSAVIFFVVDQPYLDSNLIEKVVEKSCISNKMIIAARVAGYISHPVLFRREIFPKLLETRGDVGGKSVFKDEIMGFVDWHDEKLLLDIDTLEDYEKIKKSQY
jgi:molybdenum cofactor cytidylyltransferase